jgi:multidrug efflux pump subunit AcrA (membrane-fusion protein)
MLRRTTDQAAIPVVDVVHPQLAQPTQEVVLPGTMQAFIDTPVYARTSGYLRTWSVDIGARVKKGDLLAEIDTPEVDQQLQQSRADLETTQANLDLARITADRWQSLLKSGSVSRQETDQAVSDMHAKQATVDSGNANVRRLEDLQSFEKVCAPFDGVITARSTDIGALIDAKLVRNASSIDPASRTLLTEVDVNNPNGRLLPGAYVSVHLKLPQVVRTVVIPSNTLLFRSEGLRVGVVRAGVQGSVAQLRAIRMGRDFGETVEIVSGLQPSENVILNPADSLIDGTPVHVKQSGAAQ